MALPTHLHRSDWESFNGHSLSLTPCNRNIYALDKGLPLEVIHRLCEPQVSVGQGPRSMAKDDPLPHPSVSDRSIICAEVSGVTILAQQIASRLQ